MKTLSQNELLMVTGARIRPSEWLYPAAFGTLAGVSTFAVTAFSAHPVGFALSIGTGFCVGLGFGAVHDYLREYDL